RAISYAVLTDMFILFMFFFFSSRRRHTRSTRDWSSDVCSSDLVDDPVTRLGCIQSRNRRRAVQESRYIRRVMHLRLESEGRFVGHPARGLRLQLIDQVGPHIKIARARSAAKPFH